MPEHNRIKNMKKALAFLELKELDHINWSIETGWKEVTFTHEHDELEPGERRKVKSHFPCHKLVDGYNRKDYKGSHKVDDSLTINVRLTTVLACKKMDPEDLAGWTEDQWDEYKAKAMDGVVAVIDCRRPGEDD